MIFLIEYDRRNRRLETFREFPESEWQTAQDERLKLEVELNRRQITNEVVLLQAETKEALRKTHRRYFEDLVQLTGPLFGFA